MKRVYVCHTFYHAYIACVKELLYSAEGGSPLVGSPAPGEPEGVRALSPAPDREISPGGNVPEADLVLSTMSNDWGKMPDRLREKGLFRKVVFFEEQRGDSTEELCELHRDRGNLFLNLLQRMKYTKLLGKVQEPYVPVDFRDYDEVSVFCDSDPIGYYLNYKRIPYHALEDGLNSGKLDDQARLSNAGAFRLKALLAKLGLIFIESGYSRYCIDYEVNDLSANFDPPKNMIEVPRRPLIDRLSPEDHALLADVFLPDAEGLRAVMRAKTRPAVMILTEPLCAPDVREKLFGDIIAMYSGDFDVIVKPHPRDELDYERVFGGIPGLSVLTGRFPMEVLDDVPEFRIDRLVSVITQVDDVRFAEHTEYLGLDFLDRYEDPAVHRKMERLTGKRIGEETGASVPSG